jgi:hypothetical protein
MTNVFISWSGDQSKAIAEELRVWIPSVLQFAKPYFTPNDIEKGAKWSGEISKKLSESNIGIVCLTKDNITKPWILFEAGALSKDLDKSRVCSVLFGMEDTDFSGPLTLFQATKFEKSDFKKMMKSINDAGLSNALPSETFDRVFEKWWPEVHTKITEILAEDVPSKDANIRSDRELLEEILVTARSISRLPRLEGAPSGRVPSSLIRELADVIENTIEINNKFSSMQINDDIVKPLIRVLFFLSGSSGHRSEELEKRIESMREQQENFIPF